MADMLGRELGLIGKGERREKSNDMKNFWPQPDDPWPGRRPVLISGNTRFSQDPTQFEDCASVNGILLAQTSRWSSFSSPSFQAHPPTTKDRCSSDGES